MSKLHQLQAAQKPGVDFILYCEAIKITSNMNWSTKFLNCQKVLISITAYKITK